MVYFRFKGDCTKGIEDVNVSIDRKALEGVEESVLTKLADDAWNTSYRKAGHTADDPIMTTPLQGPCKDDWDPSLAHMIADAYRYHQEKKKWDARIENTNKDEANVSEEPPRLKLPDGVELEDALVVLDYYGLKMDESVNFDFSECSDDVHIRAKLFFKWMKVVYKAKDFIIETLKEDPRLVCMFLFASSKLDMDYVNKGQNGDEKFVRVGGADECKQHLEWVENRRFRQSLVSSLEESGLNASFVSTDLPHQHGYCPYGEYGESCRPIAGKSVVAVAEDAHNSFLFDTEELYVIEVKVPPETRKKQRLD